MIKVVEKMVLTKYEKARLIGARALQLAMGAPPIVSAPKKVIGAVELARFEFDKKAIPLRVVRENN